MIITLRKCNRDVILLYDLQLLSFVAFSPPIQNLIKKNDLQLAACLLVFLNPEQFSSFFTDIDNFEMLRLVIVKNIYNLNLQLWRRKIISDYFLMKHSRWNIFGKITLEVIVYPVSCAYHTKKYMRSVCPTIGDVKSFRLAKLVPARFLPVKVPFAVSKQSVGWHVEIVWISYPHKLFI